MGKTAIVAPAALVGRQLERLEPACVVVQGARIAAVGPPEALSGGVGRAVTTGLTLIPGFIDSHVHSGFHPPREMVRGGVTTARDLGSPPELIHGLAAASQADDFEGPALVAAGPILTARGGYPARARWASPGTARELSGPSEAGGAVARTIGEGASVIKVALNPPAGPTLDAATLGAVVDAAHDRGVEVTGHVFGLPELVKALDAGVDELAHMLLGPDIIPEVVLRRMVASGMAVVPTLSIRFGADRAKAVRELGRFARAGGKIVYGTDLGNDGPRPGIDEGEVAAMAAAGLSARRVIASATVEAAAHLGLASAGAIEAGRYADLVGLAGDPEDHASLTRIGAVWRRGHRVERPALGSTRT